MQVQTLDRARLVKWQLKVGNEPDARLKEDTLRNRSGLEIEDWRDGDGECQSKDPDGESEKERPTVSGGDGGLDARRGQTVRG